MSEIISEQRKIGINELPAEIPDFSSTFEPKDSVIKKWITNWILSAVSKNKIKENDILPNKSEISKYLGVSIGTVQNAIRYIEDEGYLKSKQKLGTMISNCSNPIVKNPKLTSKRDKTVIAVKKVIIRQGIEKNKPVPSTRKMSEIIGISQNTIRLAYEYLCSQNILESKNTRGNDSNWYLKNIPVLSKEEVAMSSDISSDTLVDKITSSLFTYLTQNYDIGDRIPTHEQLSEKLNVSIKTIHDAIETLTKQGIIITRRGKYGSVLANKSLNLEYEQIENSIFASAQDAAFYSYQKIENLLVNLINEKYKSGDKLPSMQELAKNYNVSTNTIRKALNNLAYDGYITFSRGRYGGSFVVDKPETADKEQYQWLSINPEYM